VDRENRAPRSTLIDVAPAVLKDPGEGEGGGWGLIPYLEGRSKGRHGENIELAMGVEKKKKKQVH